MTQTVPRRARRLAVPLAALAAVSLLLLGQQALAADTTAARPTVVTVWLGDYPIPGYLDQRKALAAEFNQQHPQYEVRVEAHPYAALPGDVAKAVAAGQPAPTLANYYYNASQQAIDLRTPAGRPVFTSVQQAIHGRDRILGVPVVTGDLHPSVRATYSVRGELLAQPITSQTSVMYANQPALAKAGITALPRTWDELTAACQALAATPGSPPKCVAWSNQNWYFQQAVAQQGAPLVDHLNGRAGRATASQLASPGMLHYAQWWQSLYKSGYYFYSGKPEDWPSISAAWAQGQIAFMFDSSNQDIFLPTPFAKLAAGLPVPSAPRPGQGVPNIASGDALWLRDGLTAREQDGALAFAQFLSTPAALSAFAQKTGYLPVTRAGAAELERSGWLATHPAAKAGLERIAAAPTDPQYLTALTGNFDPVQNQLLLAMDDVLNKDAPIADRFRQAQQAADANLAAYNALCPGPGAHPAWCYQVGVWG
jgi:sn-glycerol 3-phosphate transport system substrate-binding protein